MVEQVEEWREKLTGTFLQNCGLYKFDYQQFQNLNQILKNQLSKKSVRKKNLEFQIKEFRRLQELKLSRDKIETIHAQIRDYLGLIANHTITLETDLQQIMTQIAIRPVNPNRLPAQRESTNWPRNHDKWASA